MPQQWKVKLKSNALYEEMDSKRALSWMGRWTEERTAKQISSELDSGWMQDQVPLASGYG